MRMRRHMHTEKEKVKGAIESSVCLPVKLTRVFPPVPVRSPKLNYVDPGQYLNE